MMTYGTHHFVETDTNFGGRRFIELYPKLLSLFNLTFIIDVGIFLLFNIYFCQTDFLFTRGHLKPKVIFLPKNKNKNLS